MTRTLWLAVSACALAAALACARQSSNPTSPSAGLGGGVAAAPDGSTLKATAPVAQAPVGGVRLPDSTQNVTLVVGNSTMTYTVGTAVALTYRFEVYDSAGTRVYSSPAVNGGNGTTSHTVSATLENDKTYSWQARAEFLGAVTAWTARATFMTPAIPAGYMTAQELYDPLIDGKTLGEIHGAVQFIPGVGVKLLDWTSYISYELPQTLLEGEYSLIVTNMPANTKGGKQKVMSMGQGYSDIVTNDRRMTVEKRGDPPGIIAWRFITHDDQVDTEGAERTYYNFQANLDYLFKATWRGNLFNVLIREGGMNGAIAYDYGKYWSGRPYDPTPHVIFIGAPVGRSGPDAATIENTIYRQVWVSARPRPGFAK
jgi:hypothetical protein